VADEESSSGGSGLSKAADRLRETTKWLIAAFAAIGATLVAGSQLSNVGSLIPGHEVRFAIAIVGVLVAFVGVALAIYYALNVAVAGSVSLGELARRNATDPLKNRIETDPALMAGNPSLATLNSDYVAAMTARKQRYAAYLADDTLLDQAKMADAHARFASDTVQSILEVANFGDVAQAFKTARGPLFLGAVIAALGVVVFAAAANPPKNELQTTRPAVTLSLDTPARTLSAAFEAVGLAHDDEVRVWITRKPRGTTLYRGLFGPDASGKVKQSVKLPVPARRRSTRILVRAWSGDAAPPRCTSASTWKTWDAKDEAACAAIVVPGTAREKNTSPKKPTKS
jgi:hypothetical protein